MGDSNLTMYRDGIACFSDNSAPNGGEKRIQYMDTRYAYKICIPGTRDVCILRGLYRNVQQRRSASGKCGENTDTLTLWFKQLALHYIGTPYRSVVCLGVNASTG